MMSVKMGALLATHARVLPRPDLVHNLMADETFLAKHREDLGLEELPHGLRVDRRGRLEFTIGQEAPAGYDAMNMWLPPKEVSGCVDGEDRPGQSALGE